MVDLESRREATRREDDDGPAITISPWRERERGGQGDKEGREGGNRISTYPCTIWVSIKFPFRVRAMVVQ